MKIVYRAFFLSLLIMSCKMTSNIEVMPDKKANILERTKWKKSGVGEGDIILDFCTSSDVVEYIFLDGIEKTKRKGTYRVKNRTILKIKWSKLVSDRVSGVINNKTMELMDETNFKKTKYYKIAEY